MQTMRINNWSKGILSSVICGLFAIVAPASAAPDLTDQKIGDAVEDQLVQDNAVSENRIDITTVSGIVTLTGHVDNILAKERSVRIARSVKGVRGVVDQLRVDPVYVPSDEKLEQDVNSSLLIDPATESFEIDVEATKGIVTLSGEVQSWQEKELAAKVAKGTKGVMDLINSITIDYRQDRPDHEIQNEIKAGLKWNALVDDGLIDVKVEDGKVTLSGTVGSAAEKFEARTEAWVAGVTKVKDEDLTVARWARDEDLRQSKYEAKSDEAIQQAISDAFLYDPRVNSFRPRIEVDNGIVTLRGTVSNLKAKRAAADDARNTVGVLRVKNRLKVRSEVPLADESIAADIRSALSRDPLVDRFEITTNVLNGKAYLYGTVDTYYEKAQANDVVSRVRGVVDVENNLSVDNDLIPYTYDPYVDDHYLYDYDWYSYQPGYTFKSDREIKEDIRDELWWSPFVDSEDVDVSVDDGVAILTGTVNSVSEYMAARENALEGGATWVRNELDIQ